MRWYIIPLLLVIGCATPTAGTDSKSDAPFVNVQVTFGGQIDSNGTTAASSPGVSHTNTQEAEASPDVTTDLKVPAPGTPPLPVVPE